LNESGIFGISVRAYIVFIMVTAYVIMNFMKIDVDSSFSTLVVSLVAYYFGNKPSSTPTESTSNVEVKQPMTDGVKPQ